jgi:hypothetical protein
MYSASQVNITTVFYRADPQDKIEPLYLNTKEGTFQVGEYPFGSLQMLVGQVAIKSGKESCSESEIGPSADSTSHDRSHNRLVRWSLLEECSQLPSGGTVRIGGFHFDERETFHESTNGISLSCLA